MSPVQKVWFISQIPDHSVESTAAHEPVHRGRSETRWLHHSQEVVILVHNMNRLGVRHQADAAGGPLHQLEHPGVHDDRYRVVRTDTTGL